LKLNLTEFLIEVLDIIGHICLGVGVMCWENITYIPFRFSAQSTFLLLITWA